MNTELIIFRHGQTDWNREHRSMGKTDIPLNETGRAQARFLAQRLSDIPLDAVYTSPLLRASETAQEVAKPHWLIPKLLPWLGEMDLGVFEGKRKEERVALLPNFDVANDGHRKLLKMETFDQWIPKIKKNIKAILESHEGQSVAFSTHDQKMRALLVALGMPRDVTKTVLKNTAVTKLALEGHKMTILFHNDNSHLTEETI
jgi:broad specificity phosphatase PhoE